VSIQRKNPYPEYASCDEAWEYLLGETSRPNFQELRAFADFLELSARTYSKRLDRSTNIRDSRTSPKGERL